MRPKGRAWNEIRPVKIYRKVNRYAEGSSIIEIGNTKVLTTVSIEDKVPPFLKGSKTGWISAEYSMLPRATNKRNMRDSVKGKVSGRSQEIQRLIGRTLRCVLDLNKVGEKTFWIDCDVLQADGGTRTAAITGAWIALYDAIKFFNKKYKTNIYTNDFLGAISVGFVKGKMLLDLEYCEDHIADIDMNVVMTGRGKLVEVQATSEGKNFTIEELNQMIELAKKGINDLIGIQQNLIMNNNE